MSKAIQGAAMLGGAAVLGGVGFLLASTGVGFGALPFLLHGMEALALGGLAQEAGAIADALSSNRGTNIATRTPAGFRQIIRGMQRVGGTVVWRTTTGGTHRQLNYIIPFASHECWAITGLYLDGRLVYWIPGHGGYSTYHASNMGGDADGSDHTGPGGQTYNFGDLVYFEPRFGTQAAGDVITGLTANDPSWAARGGKSPYLGGCTYGYVKVRQDANQFTSEPEIRVTLLGRPVWDPRTGTTAYSDNWALHIADHLSDPIDGMGLEVNEEQLIAAANVCDEQVWSPYANAYESRYTLHFHSDTSMPKSAVLEKMLLGAAGRITEIGGEQYIWPGYFQGPSASLGAGDLRGPVRWQSARGLADRSNRVTGTYIAPNYPYNVSGNLYDTNGYYDGTRENTFNFAYQPTNFPQYAKDLLHGYPADEYTERDTNYQGPWATGSSAREGQAFKGADGLLYESLVDGNTVAPAAGAAGWRRTTWRYLAMELNLETVCSVGQAQRVAKIILERNRQEGTGSMDVSLGAYAYLQPTSTFQLTFDPAGWVDKLLEVTKGTFKQEFDEAPRLGYSVEIQETAASVYEWNPLLEERPPQGGLASPASGSPRPNPPTNLLLLSSQATALIQPDGNAIPRIRITWDTPLDGLVSQIQQQHRVTGTSTWTDDPLVDIALNQSYVAPCIAGAQYDVRIRSRRSNGATSTWVEIDAFTAGLVLSTAGTQDGLGKGSLVGQGYADGTGGIQCNPHTERLGNANVAMFPSGAVTLRALQQQTLYHVYYVDPTYSGGDVTPIATTDPSDYLGKLGYILIDSVVTPYAASGGSGTSTRYYPTSWSDTGTSSTAVPDAAYDTNLLTAATVSGTSDYTPSSIPGDDPEIHSTTGSLILAGFPAVTLGADSTLTLDYKVALYSKTIGGPVSTTVGGTAVVTVTVGSTSTEALNVSTSVARTTLSVDVPTGTDLSTVSVLIEATPNEADSDAHINRVSISGYELYIDT